MLSLPPARQLFVMTTSRTHGFMHSGMLWRNHRADGEPSSNTKRLREQISRKSGQGDTMRWRWMVDSIMLFHRFGWYSRKKSWTSVLMSLETRSRGVVVTSLNPRTVGLYAASGATRLPRLCMRTRLMFGSSRGPFVGPASGTPSAYAITHD
jgi:hypothetical protein